MVDVQLVVLSVSVYVCVGVCLCVCLCLCVFVFVFVCNTAPPSPHIVILERRTIIDIIAFVF